MAVLLFLVAAAQVVVFEVSGRNCLMSLYPESYGNNPLFPSRDRFRVVKKDESSGQGVICYHSFEPGDLVAEFHGELSRKITQHSLQIEPSLHIIDLYFVGYFLHHCSPNVHLDMNERRVYAIAPIRPGDYICMDYSQTEDRLFRQFPCRCGAENCRQWITGRMELPDESIPEYLELLQIRKTVA